jgi:Glycosyl hydrolases family 43
MVKKLLIVGAMLGLALSVAPSKPVDTAATSAHEIALYGLDAHDGTIVQVGATYYLYGGQDGCGYRLGDPSTRWCGFGVHTSTDLVNWTYAGVLFNPNNTDTWHGQSWVTLCVHGCFNPRMIQRPDGQWLLWFNAVGDWPAGNAYYVMPCTGPTGPCGPAHKPNMWTCSSWGDFSIATQGSTAWHYCTITDTGGHSYLGVEQLDAAWENGVQGQGAIGLGGLSVFANEAPGVFYDPARSLWILLYSDPKCGYCTGTGTGYMWAAQGQQLALWVNPGNIGQGAPPPTGRRDASGTSCGGQPRTAFVVDGQPYELIDLWTGNTVSETSAGLLLEPIQLGTTTSPSGQVYPGLVLPFPCAPQ